MSGKSGKALPRVNCILLRFKRLLNYEAFYVRLLDESRYHYRLADPEMLPSSWINNKSFTGTFEQSVQWRRGQNRSYSDHLMSRAFTFE